MSLGDQVMRIPDHPTQIRAQLRARLTRLGSDQPLLAATLTQLHKRCSRQTCRCRTHGERHTAWQLTYKVQGKTRTVYVPLDLLADVRSWVQEHKRLKNLLQEISQLTLALVKGHVQDRQRKKGRS